MDMNKEQFVNSIRGSIARRIDKILHPTPEGKILTLLISLCALSTASFFGGVNISHENSDGIISFSWQPEDSLSVSFFLLFITALFYGYCEYKAKIATFKHGKALKNETRKFGYFFKNISVNYNLCEDGSSVGTWERIVKSSSKEVEKLQFQEGIDGEGASLGDSKTELDELSQGRERKLVASRDSEGQYRAWVKFTPPIQKNEEHRYIIRRSSGPGKFLVYKDQLEPLPEGWLFETPHEYISFTPRDPIEELCLSIRFPTDIAPTEGFCYSVYSGDIPVLNKEEIDRICVHSQVEVNPVDGGIILTLGIKEPLIGFTYFLMWTPPIR